jgi:hypothetical protein
MNPSTYLIKRRGGSTSSIKTACERACRPERRSPVARARRKVVLAVRMCRESSSSAFSGAISAFKTIDTSHEGVDEAYGGVARSMLLTRREQTSSAPGSNPVSARETWPIAAL